MEISVATLRSLAGPLDFALTVDRARRTAHSWLLTIDVRRANDERGRVLAKSLMAYRTRYQREKAMVAWRDREAAPGEPVIVMDADDMKKET